MSKKPKNMTPESPDAKSARLKQETLEREIIFGVVKSRNFYLKIRESVCPWDAEKGFHRNDFSVTGYNTLFEIVAAHYHRFSLHEGISEDIRITHEELRNALVDQVNKKKIADTIGDALLAEIDEERDYTANLSDESLMALADGAAFSSWLKRRIFEQTVNTITSRKTLGDLTLEGLVDLTRTAEKAVRGLDFDIITPPPRSFEEILPGKFPIGALNPVTREIAEQAADVHCIPVSVTALTTLATISGAIGKSVQVVDAVNGHVTPSNLYIVIAAPKSFGKGAASQLAKPILDASELYLNKFLRETQPRLLAEIAEIELKTEYAKRHLRNVVEAVENHAEKPDEIRTDLGKLLLRKKDIEKQLKTIPTLWIGSATGAALSDNLAANNETIFSYSAEAGDMIRIAMGRYNKDKSGDFDLFLSGYTGELTGESRVSRGTNRMRPCISALWFCQPLLLNEILANDEATERGLTARILSHVVEQKEIPMDDGVVRAIMPKANQAWGALIRSILEKREALREPVQVHCSLEAREVFRAFHNESVKLRNGQFNSVEGELGRWRENAIRVAAGQWVADFNAGLCFVDSPLTENQAVRAVSLVKWINLSILAVSDKSRAAKKLEEVHQMLDRVRRMGPEISLRDLDRRAGVSREKILGLAGEFSDLMRVVKRTPPNGGRPSEMLQILN